MACICELAVAIDNALPVYVLQHPDETDHSRGSAIIAHLCLQHYQCWVAEDFSSHPGLHRLLDHHGDGCLLVYPAPHAETLMNAEDGRRLRKMSDPQCLIFIDANWRKTKKIWHSTPRLQTLAAMRLKLPQPSRYRIRKAPEAAYISTVESIAHSLMWLENDEQKYQPLLNIFDEMIERQIDRMGQHTYMKNYVSRDADKSQDN